MAQIFSFIFIFILFYYLGGVNPSSWIAFLTIFMMFIFLEILSLRLAISKKEIVGLNLVFILILMFLMSFMFLVFFN